MLSQHAGTFYRGTLKGDQLVILPDCGTSNPSGSGSSDPSGSGSARGLCFASMLFPNVDLLASDKCEDDLPETRTQDTRQQHRDADLSDVWESIGTTTAATMMGYNPDMYKYAYADVRDPGGRAYLDEKGLWSLADRAGVVAMDAATVLPMLQRVVHEFCREMLTEAIGCDEAASSVSWAHALEQILPFQVAGLRCSQEWPGHGVCDDPEPIVPSVDLETAFALHANKLLDAYYFPEGSGSGGEKNIELYRDDFPFGQASYKMAPRPFQPDLDSAFAQRLSELKWYGYSHARFGHQLVAAMGVVLEKACFKQGLLCTWASVAGSEHKRLSNRVVALLQMNCEHLLVHTLRLAHQNAASTGRSVGSSIKAKNPWSHAFARDEKGRLKALENKWCSDEQKNDEMPFWFVKGEDIDFASLAMGMGRTGSASKDMVSDDGVSAPSPSARGKEELFLDPVAFSHNCAHSLRGAFDGVRVSKEASVAVQEEYEVHMLKILSLASARSRSEANVASLNNFISKSSEPMALAKHEEWEAAGVNLDTMLDRENPSVVLNAVEEAMKKLVTHRCKTAQANPSWVTVLTKKHLAEAEEIVKNCPKLRRPRLF
jgi:hypothetical protein